MIHADPWDEIPRLESLMEADLIAGLEQSRLRASAESFCAKSCRVGDRCPLAQALDSRDRCPLFLYVRSKPLWS